jgi:hypothetical protein
MRQKYFSEDSARHLLPPHEKKDFAQIVLRDGTVHRHN